MKWFSKFLAQCEVDYEMMRRGTFAGIGFLLPLAIMAGTKLAQHFAKKKGSDAAGKETQRVGEANADATFQSQVAAENNREDDRLARTQGIAQTLTGNRALSPEVIAAAMKRRATVARKGATLDPTKGSTWNMVGDMAGDVGQYASAYMSGKGMAQPQGNGMTSVLGKVAGGTGACPQGTQGSNGECYSA